MLICDRVAVCMLLTESSAPWMRIGFPNRSARMSSTMLSFPALSWATRRPSASAPRQTKQQTLQAWRLPQSAVHDVVVRIDRTRSPAYTRLPLSIRVEGLDRRAVGKPDAHALRRHRSQPAKPFLITHLPQPRSTSQQARNSVLEFMRLWQWLVMSCSSRKGLSEPALERQHGT